MTREDILKMEAGREMDALVAEKVCKKCGSTRRMTLKTGYTQCLDCHNNRNKLWNKTHKRNYPWNKTEEAKKYRRTWQLKDRYGITVKEYQEIFDSQGGKCAICKKRTEELFLEL